MTSPTVNVASSIRLYQTFGYAPVVFLATVIILATLSLRDLVFTLVGCAGFFMVYAAIQRDRLEKKNANSRLLIRFDDIKRDFKPLMEKVESSYAKDNFFVNNYSKGLYHHVTFEEQLDIIKWVETVEQKLQTESQKQFEEFEKSISDMDEWGVSKTSMTLGPDGADGQPGLATGVTAEVSLRDVSHEMAIIDSINIRQADEKNLKELFSDIRYVLGDFYKFNEEAYSLWAELNNQTMDKIFKYFSSNPEESPKQLAMFSLTIDEMFHSSPSLISHNNALIKFFEGKVSIRESEKNFFGFDWDMLRTKITGQNGTLIARNTKENKESSEAFGKVHKAALDSLSKTASNIREMKEYFVSTKSKLSDIQKEFGQRLNDVKFKIASFKQNVEKCEDYELQLKLEYEIRLEINKLYMLKHSHESECVGLDKRLEELEAFNTSTELVHSLLHYQAIKFFEKCEEFMLHQSRDAALLRLSSILTCDFTNLKIEQGEEASRQIEDLYQIKLDSPITDDQFKEFLVINLLNGNIWLLESFEAEKQITRSSELALLSDFIIKIKEKIITAKSKIENFELDHRNEFEEAILIKKVPGIQKLHLKREELSEDSSLKVEIEVKSDIDWTHNKPKAKQLAESVDKMLKTLEQILKIYQANLNNTMANEVKINKILAKQDDQSLKVYLFRRLVRIYFSERLCLNDLIQKLLSVIDLLNHVKIELAWLWKTFYEDESIDKLISITTKMDIFTCLQEFKSAEICSKVFTMHCICIHLFKQFEIVQILFKDKYPDFQTHASMDDLHSWQQKIRKGSKRIVQDEENYPKSPCRSPKGTKTLDEFHTTPRKDSGSKESPYDQSISPARSSKK